jgi:hypothetical protein
MTLDEDTTNCKLNVVASLSETFTVFDLSEAVIVKSIFTQGRDGFLRFFLLLSRVGKRFVMSRNHVEEVSLNVENGFVGFDAWSGLYSTSR